MVPFPFTDLSGRKIRPAVVVSANPQGPDVVVAFVSSVMPAATGAADELVLPLTDPDAGLAGLKRPSVIKLRKLITLHHSLILRKLGQVSPAIQRELDQRLAKAVGLA